MKKRIMQAMLLLAVLVVGVVSVGASSLQVKFFDDEALTVPTTYMNYYVEQTSVEQQGNEYVVTVEFADAYASVISDFSVADKDVVKTASGVYEYTINVADLNAATPASLTYVRPTNNVSYTYSFYVSYE